LPLNSSENDELDRETRKLLQEADWETIRRELLAYVTWRARGYRWHRKGDLELAEGYMVDDVVHDVIAKAWCGIRKWDPTRGELLPWLRTQSRSILDNLARSAPHRREVSVLDLEDMAAAYASDPLEILLRQEAWAQKKHRVEQLLQAVEGEPELEQVLWLIIHGCEPKPRYLASELGVPVCQINNRLKRLRRRALRMVNQCE
jgi:RNA polymerase sigma factor (sigma-70 family)